MAYRGMTLPCPVCSDAMADFALGADTLQRCPSCRGFWIEVGTIGSVLARGFPRRAPELVEHEDGSDRHPCPVCRDEMRTVWLEFLGLERCAPHGLWVERGELNRIVHGDVVPADLPKPDLKNKRK